MVVELDGLVNQSTLILNFKLFKLTDGNTSKKDLLNTPEDAL